MKKTAKFLSLLLAAVMLLLSFASCDVISGIIGGNGQGNIDDGGDGGDNGDKNPDDSDDGFFLYAWG